MYYWVYGFPVRSEFELPELLEIDIAAAANSGADLLEIVAGPVPEALTGERRIASWISFSGRTCLYTFSDVARILVEDGKRVVVQMEAGAEESDMRTYLVGSGLGTIAHQRGMIPLHVSSVLTPSGAIAFTGPSGAGKSTMAANLNAEFGWPLISDDVAIMRLTDGGVEIEGGVYRCRLWRDALDRLSIQTDGLVPDLHRTDKYQVLLPDLFARGTHRLLSITEINHDAISRDRIMMGAEKFRALIDTVYRPYLVGAFQDQLKFVRTILEVTKRIDFTSTVPRN